MTTGSGHTITPQEDWSNWASSAAPGFAASDAGHAAIPAEWHAACSQLVRRLSASEGYGFTLEAGTSEN